MIWNITSPKGYGRENLFVACKSKDFVGAVVGSCCLLPLLAFGTSLAVILLHLVVVFVCPSHDLCMIHGCTAIFDMSMNATNASGLYGL